MRNAILTLVALALLVRPVAAAAVDPTPAPANELASITARGRMLAEYDAAASRATDALKAQSPDTSRMGKFIALKMGDGWVVEFGQLNERKDKFLAAYEVAFSDASVSTYTPAEPYEGFWLKAALALNTTLAVFKPVAPRTYNYAVLPGPGGQMWVYYYPAQRETNVYPLGGDFRYLVSADGLTIVESRRMHIAILDMRFDPKEDAQQNHTVVAGTHSAVVGESPEDTDVFYVLTRRPRIPEYIGTKHFMYVIETDGSIRFLQKL